ncbi:MAG: HD family phosphohydrolase [Bacteroidales bacterium]
MKRLYRFLLSHSSLILKGLMFLVSVVIVVYFFPREGKFRYEFQKGKPWMHDVLIAPYDFPIYKSEARLAAEKDSIFKDFKPYFVFDSTIMLAQLSRFDDHFDEVWGQYVAETFGVEDTSSLPAQSSLHRRINRLRAEYRVKGKYWLEYIYSKGIVSIPEVFNRVNNPDDMIVVMKGKVAENVDYKQVFTQKGAYEYIIEQARELYGEEGEQGEAFRFFLDLDLDQFIEPNLSYDDVTTNRVMQSMVEDISLTEGMVQQGMRIISRGELVGDYEYRVLESLRKEYEKRIGAMANRFMILAGQFLLVFVAFTVIFLFLLNFRKEILQNYLKLSFILFLVVFFVVISALSIRYSRINIYIIPLTILPIMIRTFYDSRLALFIHLVTILVIGFLAPNAFEFVFLSIMAGIAAIFSLTNTYRRGKLFLSALLITLTYVLVYSGIGIIQEGDIRQIEGINYLWFAGNGGLILLTYPLIYLFEKVFGFLSDATLIELSDTNQPLLRKLAEKAPGSFQHSLQVANLAEAAATKIGANTLLVRAGALYHDIGKMDSPIFFIENQNNGANPHDNMEFEESARVIIGHVQKGVEIARKHNLPVQLIDFIRTHHGTTKVQYFYRSYIRKYSENMVETNKFSYPGPKPFSREMAILMMADSVEAASRSMKDVTRESLHKLVDQILDYQISEGQFDNADITFRDIRIIREILKERLANIYHARIEYPND